MNSVSGRWSSQLKLFWLAVGIPVCLLWGTALCIRLTPPYRHLHDFVQEWTSARNYFVGQPIYLALSESIPLHFGQPYEVLLNVNAHPPASVLISLPFGKLDYSTAYLTWNLLSLLMLVISMWLIMRPKGLGYSPWAVLPITVFILISNSFAQQVNQGQLNLLLLLLFTGCWLAMRGGRSATAGTILGLAMAIKLFPGYLFLYFAARRDWIAIIYGGLAFAFLNGLTGGILGWDCFRDYAMEVVPQVGGFRDYWPNASIAGYASKLLDGSSGHVVPLFHAPLLATTVSGLGCVAVTVAYLWRTSQADSMERRDAAFGMGIVAMLLVSPITWDHYFLLLTLPLAILWKSLPPTIGNRFAILAATSVLIVLNPKHIWDATIPGDGELVFEPGLTPSVALPWHTLTVISYQFYALMALFVFSWRAKTVSIAHDRQPTTDHIANTPAAPAIAS